ncbi:MAG: STAS domain-containing protein [Synergistaceae bacterium]|nr:STAS domain-containing protein [Synergistaceae bacterium]
MLISKQTNGTELTVALDGRLDTTTAPELEAELRGSIKDIKELVFDMTKLAYISSAGLRVLLKAQKVMNKQGKMAVKNANSDIVEIFEVTGFDEILNIE